MDIKQIRPIPKYMLKRIETYDKKYYPAQDGKTCIYAYLTRYGKELVKISVAVKCRRKKQYSKINSLVGKTTTNKTIENFIGHFL